MLCEVTILNEALTYLQEYATTRGLLVELSEAGNLWLTLDVPHVDGVHLAYRIEVGANGPFLSAREDPSCRRLPEFCPERHIITGGGFCMYWPGELSFAVHDSESAEKWLNLLLNFLRLQRRAAKQRRWPNLETWAHGNEAAVQQLRAERTARRLGPEFKSALDTRTLKAIRGLGGSVRVVAGDLPLFTVVMSPNRFDRRGGRLRRVYEFQSVKKSRGVRAELLEELAGALVRWDAEEKRFWVCHQDKKCCRTIDSCPLNNKFKGGCCDDDAI